MYITNNFLRLTSTLILGLQLLTFGMTDTGLSSDLLWSQSEVVRSPSGWSIEHKEEEKFEPKNNGGGPDRTGDTGTRCCGSSKSSIPE